MPTFVIHFDRRLEAKFSAPYQQKLTDLLQEQFTLLTGLKLGSQCWFMLALNSKTITQRRHIFAATADIIGPDSCGHRCELVWKEDVGMPVCAAWTLLPAPEIINDYGNVRPRRIKIARLPFAIDWNPWWDSHLPDFYLFITFNRAVVKLTVDQITNLISAFNPGYTSVRKTGKTVTCHVDFGSSPFGQREMKSLFKAFAKIHKQWRINKIAVGLA